MVLISLFQELSVCYVHVCLSAQTKTKSAPQANSESKLSTAWWIGSDGEKFTFTDVLHTQQ